MSSSNETTLRNLAINTPGVLALPSSLTTKIYALELVIASTTGRTLLVEVSVSYSYNTPQNQALAFANYVNGEGGQNALGNCEATLSNLVVEFNRLSSDGRTYYENSTDSSILLARERMAYLSTWVANNQAKDRSPFIKEKTNDYLFILFLIGFLPLLYIWSIVRR